MCPRGLISKGSCCRHALCPLDPSWPLLTPTPELAPQWRPVAVVTFSSKARGCASASERVNTPGATGTRDRHRRKKGSGCGCLPMPLSRGAPGVKRVVPGAHSAIDSAPSRTRRPLSPLPRAVSCLPRPIPPTGTDCLGSCSLKECQTPRVSLRRGISPEEIGPVKCAVATTLLFPVAPTPSAAQRARSRHPFPRSYPPTQGCRQTTPHLP